MKNRFKNSKYTIQLSSAFKSDLKKMILQHRDMKKIEGKLVLALQRTGTHSTLFKR